MAEWFVERARAHRGFEASLVDLAELSLPLFDEPRHPKLGEYAHEHTRRWSRIVAASDAFVFVLPEYNHGAPPAFVNCVDFLSREWAYKAAGLVSYGGISGGTRASAMAKQLLTTVKVMPMFEQVIIPMIEERMKDGRFEALPPQTTGATLMLDELLKWTTALKTIRG